MSFVRVILKSFSCLFLFVLSAFLTVLALFLILTNAGSVRMAMLPLWSGTALKYWMLGLGLFGLLSVAFAVSKKNRVLLVVASAVALGLIVYGYFLGPYRFAGAAEAKSAAWLAFGALGAFFGSLMQFPARRA